MNNWKQLKDKSSMDATTKSSVKRHVAAFVVQHPVPTRFYNHIIMFMRKPLYAALSIVLLFGMLSGGTVYASQDALPGEPLYKVKLATETARTHLTRDEQKKAELHLKHAQRRVDELQKLITAGTVTPELVKETQSLLSDLIGDVEAMAEGLTDVDSDLAVDLSVNAKHTSDKYVEAFKSIPDEKHDQFGEVAPHVVSESIKHDKDFMGVLLDSYATNPTEKLREEIRQAALDEHQKHLDFMNMMDGGMKFASTVDSASAKLAEDIQKDISKVKAFDAKVEAFLNDPNFDPNRMHELFEQAPGVAPPPHEIFEKVEHHFSDPKYKDVEYDGPWIDDEKHHFDPHSGDGDCHFTEDRMDIECMEGDDWNVYDPAYFKETLMPTGKYYFEGPEGSLDFEPDEIDNPQPQDQYPDQPEDEIYELIMQEYDKDGDGEVDCIGEKACPDQDFFEKIFNRDCNEDCQKMFDEHDKKMMEMDKYDDEDDYDYDDDLNHFPPPGDEYHDDNPNHFPPPVDDKQHPDEWGSYDPNDPYEDEDHGDDYDPNDPYEGME